MNSLEIDKCIFKRGKSLEMYEWGIPFPYANEVANEWPGLPFHRPLILLLKTIIL